MELPMDNFRGRTQTLLIKATTSLILKINIIIPQENPTSLAAQPM
jgi:hypothetical protein